MRHVEPQDWDITTAARPEQILSLFPGAKYQNQFGTVIYPLKNEKGQILEIIEITTYRSEGKYSDFRHPDEIKFEDKLEKDLSRRDFTVNAMALKPLGAHLPIAADLKKYVLELEGAQVVDLFGGLKDIKNKIIRAVGEPSDRFKEDALRMMRAVRFVAQLDFTLEPKTERAIKRLASSIRFIAKERIRDELIKILSSPHPYYGIKLLHQTRLLQYILPELEQGVGVQQNRHHRYTVFEHSLFSLKYCPNPDWRVRLAALLHDVAKPLTKRIVQGEATFYNHEVVGAKIVTKIMRRLHFAKKDIDKVVTLVKNHMFYYNVDEVTASSVRRLIRKVGKDNLQDLIDLRVADRLGSGVPKAKPYKLRHLEYMMKKVQNDPISVKMLKINGNDLMNVLKIPPSPKIGAILDVLLSEIIENPSLNNREYLLNRSLELNHHNLEELRQKAREIIQEKQKKEDDKLKKEFWVK